MAQPEAGFCACFIATVPSPWAAGHENESTVMHAIPELDRRGLRKFGLTLGAIIALLFGAALPWLFGFAFPWWPWIVGAFFAVWALTSAQTLEPVYRWWMKFGLVINAVMSRVILAAVFYLVVLPTGLILRIRGRDPMRRKLDKAATTYRTVSRRAPPDQMEKPF